MLFGQMSTMMSLLAILRLSLLCSSDNQQSKRGYCHELAHDQCVGVPQSALEGGKLIRSSRFRKKQGNSSESRRIATWISLGLQNQTMKVIVDLKRTCTSWIEGTSNLSQNNMHFCSQLALLKCNDVICETVNWLRLHPQCRADSN